MSLMEVHPVIPSLIRGPSFLGAVGALGQVVQTDVAKELANRGYAVHVPPVVHAPAVEIKPAVLTKSRAIEIAVDTSLAVYQVSHTSTHPYRCPSAKCYITQAKWDHVVKYGVTLANYYLKYPANLPTWAKPGTTQYLEAERQKALALRGFHLGQGEVPIFPARPEGMTAEMPGTWATLDSWLKDHPLALDIFASVSGSVARHYRAKALEESIGEQIPKDLATRSNMEYLATLITQKRPGLTAAEAADIKKGALAVALPGWFWPVLVGAGVVLVVTLIGH